MVVKLLSEGNGKPNEPGPSTRLGDLESRGPSRRHDKIKMAKTPNAGNTLELRHRQLCTLLTKLTREDTTKAPAPVKYRIETAIKEAVQKSLQEGDFDPTDWEGEDLGV